MTVREPTRIRSRILRPATDGCPIRPSYRGDGECPRALQVIALKPEIQRLADNATSHVAVRLLADAPNRVDVFRVESDIISQINRLYYYAKRIAKVIARDEDPQPAEKRVA